MLKRKNCKHLEGLEIKFAPGKVCETCVQHGDTWVHLRTCQTCGITLCCDSSPNQHASKHFAQTGHPVVISAEVREDWALCYADREIKMYRPK